MNIKPVTSRSNPAEYYADSGAGYRYIPALQTKFFYHQLQSFQNFGKFPGF